MNVLYLFVYEKNNNNYTAFLCEEVIKMKEYNDIIIGIGEADKKINKKTLIKIAMLGMDKETIKKRKAFMKSNNDKINTEIKE